MAAFRWPKLPYDLLTWEQAPGSNDHTALARDHPLALFAAPARLLRIMYWISKLSWARAAHWIEGAIIHTG